MTALPTRVPWTPEQIAILRTRYPHERTENIANDLGMSLSSVYYHADKLGLKKTAEYLTSPDACRLRRGDNVGAEYRFPKGHVPQNKGRKGYCPPGCVPTQFKKGQKPHTWRPVGSERISKDGYLQRKITDTGYPPRDWVGVHILTWREHHGDVPAGHAVVFKNGNKRNITIENLELISRRDLMRRNSLHNYPKEISKIIQLRGALNRKINAQEKQREQQSK